MALCLPPRGGGEAKVGGFARLSTLSLLASTWGLLVPVQGSPCGQQQPLHAACCRAGGHGGSVQQGQRQVVETVGWRQAHTPGFQII